MSEEFDFAADRSEAAQAARYKALIGKKVLWLTCYYTAEGYDSVKDIMDNCIAMGVKLYVVCGLNEADKKLAEKMTTDGIAEKCIFTDMTDSATACDNIFNAAVATGVNFDAVFSPHEVVQTLIGELSERMNLPGTKREPYVNARDKWRSRLICKEAGLSTPKFMICRNANEIETAVKEVGVPLILKPTAGSASEGVYKCESLEEALDRFDAVSTEFEQNSSFSWNPGCTLAVMCEEYIDGDEYDVDVLMWDGNVVYSGIVDNWPTMEPTFLETGSNFPSLASESNQNCMKKYAADCIRALGFTQGCFHVEIKQTFPSTKWVLNESGEKVGRPYLIEVNPRMGGGRTRKFHRDVSGIEIFDNFFMASCGIPICPPLLPAPRCAVAEYEVCCEVTGVQVNDRWLDHLRDVPGVEECTVYNPPGTWVKGADRGIPQWIGLIVIKGTTPEETVEHLQNIVATVDPPIQPDDEKPID